MNALLLFGYNFTSYYINHLFDGQTNEKKVSFEPTVFHRSIYAKGVGECNNNDSVDRFNGRAHILLE